MFVTLDGFDKRKTDDLYYEAIANKLRGAARRARSHEADDHDLRPAAGARRGPGRRLHDHDRGPRRPGAARFQAQTENHRRARPTSSPRWCPAATTSVFRANVPQVFLDVDRTACMLKGVKLQDVFQTLQVYLGSLYVNDFNLFGRTWQVIAQAEAKFRDQMDDISRLRVRNSSGTMVPLGRGGRRASEINGPLVLTRYNMYPAASINGNAGPGVSSGQAIDVMSRPGPGTSCPSR